METDPIARQALARRERAAEAARRQTPGAMSSQCLAWGGPHSPGMHRAAPSTPSVAMTRAPKQRDDAGAGLAEPVGRRAAVWPQVAIAACALAAFTCWQWQVSDNGPTLIPGEPIVGGPSSALAAHAPTGADALTTDTTTPTADAAPGRRLGRLARVVASDAERFTLGGASASATISTIERVGPGMGSCVPLTPSTDDACLDPAPVAWVRPRYVTIGALLTRE